VTEEQLLKLLRQFKNGQTSQEQILDKLKRLPFEDLEFAKVDHHRSLRRGFPEVIYGEGKTIEEILHIAEKMASNESPVLITRLDQDKSEALQKAFPKAVINERARTISIPGQSLRLAKDLEVNALVLTAGTSDAGVAEEAAVTVESFGYPCDRIYDVGVAGLHRLLSHGDRIKKADAIAVIAGMEGALPSVVGGLVDVPVIAVPTSIGYGANFGGISALLGMLTGCAGGVAVVNIDNGFAAGFMLATILRNLERNYLKTKSK